MLTLNQTAGNNSATIWVLKINTSTPIYISTRNLSLDTTFDGEVLNYDNYITDLNYNSTIQESGGAGSVTNFSFSISRHSNNTSVDGFFNEFYPATSGVYLSGRTVQLGVCWTGATADTDITWLFNGRVVDYNYEQRKLNITVFQESEITNKEIPYYQIQKDFDNEISYFPSADKDIYGDPIFIVYGSFNVWKPIPIHDDIAVFGEEFPAFVLCPVIITNKKNLEMLVCSHKVKTTNWNVHYISFDSSVIFKYLSGINNYMMTYKGGDTVNSNKNTYGSFKFNMMDTVSRMYGKLKIPLTQISAYAGTTDLTNVIDNDPTTYAEIDEFAVSASNRVALNVDGSENTSEVGYLSQDSTDITINFAMSSEDINSRNYRIGFRNTAYTTPQFNETSTTSVTGTTVVHKTHSFADSTTAKSDTNLPYTIEEICSYDYYVINYAGGTGDLIRVYYGYIDLADINVTGVVFKNKGYGTIKTPNIRGTSIKIRIPGLHT